MARLRRCCCGVNFGFSGSGAGGTGGTRWGGGAGAIVGFKIIRDSCRGIQGPSASNGAGSAAGLGGGAMGFGIGVSLKTILIKQYSIKAMNTNTVQTDMNASTAFSDLIYN
ncbi:hypothetical protein GQX74_004847 [Glossina fuscipes]|nr:hypothetical protein GQX74_004847 [Glossina fuscipes]